ncbi:MULTISPECIES: two-component regulator propeller domain-containing protein [unclassified Methanoregula]|uniref:two-component regulator propeller domain-containing protein n=1 Tax=unclassified Methanoregula TaxID=2649730 RepID=UPI0009C8CC04|nr:MULTISPECIES: two-component regulator propeller domain-containing protein [unclassified Methanoregula]OPX64518.1 MAG: Two component regulator propeller [Methanoregula sp. PtaB.Bin085]OPY37295.1 MAG: Two component regulator propeller [Methanoregula sp. PtaU1.Bin006]
MVRPAISDGFAFLFLLLLIVPVTAAGIAPYIITTTPAGDVSQRPYSILLFIPKQTMIHSDQINDMTNGPGGETIIGTSFGLSTYNGSWSTRHTNLQNISEGLMDDYITAVERDSAGNLWIGYSGGLQIYDGNSFRSIRDQQILKETRIKDFQRWGADMWIATGHAGMHRYRNGTWTWYQPMKRTGPGFYEVKSMALDTGADAMVITTEVEGIWLLRTPEDRATFEEIAPRYSTWGFLETARRDPLGGVYLFNTSVIVRYAPDDGFVPVLSAADLAPGTIVINDITAAPDGRLFIATDTGIFIWKDGRVLDHLTRTEGLGTSPVIRTVTIDAKNRVWFSSTGYVGYYTDQAASTIPIEIVQSVAIPSTTPTPLPTTRPTTVPVVTTVPVPEPHFFPEDSFFTFLNPLIDPIMKAIGAAGSRN